MAIHRFLLILLVVALCSLSRNKADQTCKDWPPFDCDKTDSFHRNSFKPDFIFGVASSAYQIEGAEGRGLNIWDGFTHRWPEKGGPDRKNGDIAANSFKFYEDDVESLNEMGLDAYRFSIAWSRVLPKGKLSRGVNEEGIGYYDSLINNLTQKGIAPFVTLYHWDIPQTLQDEYGGFLDRQVIDDFKDFSELCFQRFGDRVKNWITFNQPYSVPIRGYAIGTDAPGRCSAWLKEGCDAGDSATEPYIVAHNQLLAHAVVVDLYKNHYQGHQHGQIGITIITRWFLPHNNTEEADINATERAKDFFIGWFMDPLTKGDYPDIMKKIVRDRLPKFNETESLLLKGSMDFLGVNYYFTQYVKDEAPAPPNMLSAATDPQTTLSYDNCDGEWIGPPVVGGDYYFPRGFLYVLEYIKDKYGNPPIYITENGFRSNGTVVLDEILTDNDRIDYICSHLCYLRSAIENGCNVNGYFVWSLADNYEFCSGYTVRFGLNYIDFNNLTTRYIKDSGKWYTDFVRRKRKVPLRGRRARFFQDDMMIAKI